jgi:hypothetical protein
MNKKVIIYVLDKRCEARDVGAERSEIILPQAKLLFLLYY